MMRAYDWFLRLALLLALVGGIGYLLYSRMGFSPDLAVQERKRQARAALEAHHG